MKVTDMILFLASFWTLNICRLDLKGLQHWACACTGKLFDKGWKGACMEFHNHCRTTCSKPRCMHNVQVSNPPKFGSLCTQYTEYTWCTWCTWFTWFTLFTPMLEWTHGPGHPYQDNLASQISQSSCFHMCSAFRLPLPRFSRWKGWGALQGDNPVLCKEVGKRLRRRSR